MSSPWPETAEWLEADGLGGFASGTAAGIRTRRYHALLLAATTPPTGRAVLVAGIEAWVETPTGPVALTSQRYAPDVTHPDGAARIERFDVDPWPRWRIRLDDTTSIEHELFVPHGAAACVLRWRRVSTHRGRAARGAEPNALRLHVRPLLACRDYHAMQHENAGFRFDAAIDGERIAWHPYQGLPPIVALANASYEHRPDWYRNFQYDQERARGLDYTEDLASPGTFTWELDAAERNAAVLVLAADGLAAEVDGASADALGCANALSARERARRRRFASPLERAADAYVVERAGGKTIVAGYPWFTDWGRDTFIALRGLAIAGDRLDDAREILTGWAGTVSEGMLPNRFPDGAGEPEFNAVDASLWYVVAVHDFLAAADRRRMRVRASDRRLLCAAVERILCGYERGTRFGIRCDDDGLLAAGRPGVQLTWMDAKVGDWVVTPRIGKPVEVQALWINALRIGAYLAERDATHWRELSERALASFGARFWSDERGWLCDVVDVDHVAGTCDSSLRPNQLFAVGGLPFPVLDGEPAERLVAAVERALLTPLGLRSLAPDAPGYRPHYEGGVRERDGAYHQGTVWPWLLGPFVEAWVRVRGGSDDAKREARARFFEPLLRHLDVAGLGHVSEIADAAAPHTPRGCPFQAWSLAEAMRLERDVLAVAPAARGRARATSQPATRSSAPGSGG